MVGISLLTLVPGVVGGSEAYARALCEALARVGTLPYRVYLPALAPDAAGGLPAHVVRSYRARPDMRGRMLAMTLAAARPGPLRRELRPEGLDALHFPLSVMLPPVDRPPAVSTIHDVQHELHPEFFSRAELAYRRVVYGWTARRSRLVVAISAHAAGTLVERLGVPHERVRVIHSGVDHARFTPAPRVREPLLLYPANRWPHKNHPRLLAAFEQVRAERPDLRLVLTGHGHDGHPRPAGVEVRGVVPAAELVELYRTAAAVVFPSLYEGFGQPPLEAMACGCPVAVARATALPEVCGDAAVYFDPLDVDSIAQGIREVLDRPPAGGLEHAARFSWEETARRYEDVYRELLAAPD